MLFRRAAHAATPLAAALAVLLAAAPASAQPFERATTDVGATGLALTNVGRPAAPA